MTYTSTEPRLHKELYECNETNINVIPNNLYGDKDSDWTNDTSGTIYTMNERSCNSGSMRWKYQRIPFRIWELMVQ